MLKVFEGHSTAVRSVAFSPDGNFIVSGLDDESIRLWDVAYCRLLKIFEWHSDEESYVFFFHRRLIGSRLLCGSVRIWDVESGKLFKILEGSVSFSPDGKFILSGSGDTSISFMEHQPWNVIEELIGHEDKIFCIAISPDGSLITFG